MNNHAASKQSQEEFLKKYESAYIRGGHPSNINDQVRRILTRDVQSVTSNYMLPSPFNFASMWKSSSWNTWIFMHVNICNIYLHISMCVWSLTCPIENPCYFSLVRGWRKGLSFIYTRAEMCSHVDVNLLYKCTVFYAKVAQCSGWCKQEKCITTFWEFQEIYNANRVC